MRSLKILIILGLFLSTSVAIANEDTTKTAAARFSEMKSKSWFLQMSVTNGIFTSTGLDGGSFTIRHQLSPRHAIRFGASFPLRIGSSEQTEIRSRTYDFDTDYRDRDESGAGLTFALRALWFRKTGRNIHPYFGIGPSYRFGSDGFDEEINSGETKQRARSSYSALSLNGNLGSEIFLMDGFSLFGEVSLGLEYRYQRQVYETFYSSPQRSDYTYSERRTSYYSVIHEIARMGFSLQL